MKSGGFTPIKLDANKSARIPMTPEAFYSIILHITLYGDDDGIKITTIKYVWYTLKSYECLKTDRYTQYNMQ